MGLPPAALSTKWLSQGSVSLPVPSLAAQGSMALPVPSLAPIVPPLSPRRNAIAASMPVAMPVMTSPRQTVQPAEQKAVSQPLGGVTPRAPPATPLAGATARSVSPPVQRPVVEAYSLSPAARASPTPETEPRHWGRASSPTLSRPSAGGSIGGMANAGSAPTGTFTGSGCSSSPFGNQGSVRGKAKQRTAAEIAGSLYEDAFARKQRLQELQENGAMEKARQERLRRHTYQQGMQERARFYRGSKDTRSHLEREEELLQKREEWDAKKEAEEKARKQAELQACTFRPDLKKSRARSPGGCRSPRASPFGNSVSTWGMATPASPRANTPRSRGGDVGKLQQLVNRQRAAHDAFQAFKEEEQELQEHLRAKHTELYEQIQREETQLVVSALQDTSKQTSEHQRVIKKAQAMVLQGCDAVATQQMVVEELVGRSQSVVQQRVSQVFRVLKQQAEGELYTRRLAVVHELEVVETLAAATKGGLAGGSDDVTALGFCFGLAEQARNLMCAPVSSRQSSPERSPMASTQHGSALLPAVSTTMSLPPWEEADEADAGNRTPRAMGALKEDLADTPTAPEEPEEGMSPRHTLCDDRRPVSFGQQDATWVSAVAAAAAAAAAAAKVAGVAVTKDTPPTIPQSLDSCRRRLQFK